MVKTNLERVVIGLDLGKKRDYTAICAVEKWQSYCSWPYEAEKNGPSIFHLTYLERFPLETDYPVQLEFTKQVFENAQERYREERIRPELIIDSTGPGVPMLDYFRKEIPKAAGCHITAGAQVSNEKGVFYVPKQHLAATLEIVFQNRRIKIAKDIPDAQTLKNEMLNFRYKTSPDTGHTSFEHWREKDHDDCVLAVAIALWYAERHNKFVAVHGFFD